MPLIFLVGFMGTGKTTLGKKIASKLKAEFIDLDQLVVKNQQVASIKELIETKGIDFFRQAESDVLKSLNVENAIISTGGGTPCYFDNMEWMKRRGVVVFLQMDEGMIFSRLKQTRLEDRPLLKDLDDTGLKSFIHEKLAERMPYYSQADINFNPVSDKMETLLAKLETTG
jgi:shikimate kinase